MRLTPIVGIVLLAFAAPVPAQAPAAALEDTDWYAVEVIVFEHRADASSGDESFPRDPGRPDLAAATHVVPRTEPPSLRAFAQLPPESLQMGGAWRTLENSSRYRPLVHVGWMQPGLGPDAAVPVVIDLAAGEPLAPEPLVTDEPAMDGMPVDGELPPDDAGAAAVDGEPPLDGADDAPPATLVDELPLAEATNPWWVAEILREEHPAEPVPEPILGTVTLLLQRFLHVGVDLVLTTDAPLPYEEGEREWAAAREDILADLTFELIGPDEARARLEALDARPRYESFRLREQRRVRTAELHYFDHPRFGVIVTVRDVEPPPAYTGSDP